MPERFTERARQVMALANQEAHRLHHAYLGSEHILLGIIREGNGIAVSVLENLEVDRAALRRQIEQALVGGTDQANIAKLPNTPEARKVTERAVAEARQLHHNYVGTEHLLLGLLLESETLAARVLTQLGADLPAVRQAMVNLIGPEAATADDTSGHLVRRAIECLQRARDAAVEEGNVARATALQDQAWNLGAVLTRQPDPDDSEAAPRNKGSLLKCPQAACGHWNEPMSPLLLPVRPTADNVDSTPPVSMLRTKATCCRLACLMSNASTS